jgi:hypothetical protein
MKKTLITEIKRQLELMSVNPKPKLLMEDGVLRTIIDAISRKLSTASPLPAQGINKVSPGVTLGDGGIILKNKELDDIQDLLTDWDANKQYLSVYPEYIQKFRDIILLDEGMRKEIFESMIDDITREVGSVYGKRFENDVQMYDFLRGEFTNIEDIKSIVKNSNPTPGKDPLVDIFYDVLAESVYNNTKKLSKGSKVDVAFNEITNNILDVSKWDQIPIKPLDETIMKKISSYITPTIRESISEYFSNFKKFNETEEFLNLELIMKRIDNETNTAKKTQLKQYVVQKYAWIYRNERKVWTDLEQWINDVLEQKKDTTPELQKALSEIKELIKKEDTKAIKRLAESDGTLINLQRDFITSLSLLGGKHNINPVTLIDTLVKKVQRFKTKDDELKKLITDELKVRWDNTTRLMKSGSIRGYYTNDVWAQLTNSNVKLAKKRYLIEVYGRALKLHAIISTIYAITKSVQSYYTSYKNKNDLNACRTFLANPVNTEKIISGTLTDSELLSSKCTFDILFAIRSQDKGALESLWEGFKPDLESGWRGILGILEFLIPGFIDDVVSESIQAYVNGFDPESPEATKNLMQKYIDELKKVEDNLPTPNNDNTNSQTEKTYKKDLNGFKLYLKDNDTNENNPKLTDGVFFNGIITYKWAQTKDDGTGMFEPVEQEY